MATSKSMKLELAIFSFVFLTLLVLTQCNDGDANTSSIEIHASKFSRAYPLYYKDIKIHVCDPKCNPQGGCYWCCYLPGKIRCFDTEKECNYGCRPDN